MGVEKPVEMSSSSSGSSTTQDSSSEDSYWTYFFGKPRPTAEELLREKLAKQEAVCERKDFISFPFHHLSLFTRYLYIRLYRREYKRRKKRQNIHGEELRKVKYAKYALYL